MLRGLKIIDLAALVAVAAIGFAAFDSGTWRYDPSINLTRLVVSLCLVVLAWSTIAAQIGPDRRRAFWFGFAVVGWAAFLAPTILEYPLGSLLRIDSAIYSMTGRILPFADRMALGSVRRTAQWACWEPLGSFPVYG